MTTNFTPEPRSTVKSVRHINYTCGPSRYAELQAIAKESGITLKELMRQMVDFAVAHYVRAQAMSAGTAETQHAAQGDSPPARSEGCAQTPSHTRNR